MLTPYNQACPYYYVHAHRRATPHERCELLQDKDAARWTSTMCRTCPVPRIAAANHCPNMVLHAHSVRRIWRFWQAPRIEIWATCPHSRKRDHRVADPMVGCGRCHDTLKFVVVEKAPTRAAPDRTPDPETKERTHD